MRNLKKFLAVLIVVAMMAAMMVPAMAAGSFKYESEATTLNKIGVFAGTVPGVFTPDLGGSLNREQGITLLVRMLAKEQAATAMSAADVKKVLVKFTDAAKVSSWAKNYIAYAIKENMVKGMSETQIGPAEKLKGKMYAAMILRAIGHAVEGDAYNKACATLAEKGGLTADEATAFEDKDLIRDDAVGISFGSLHAEYKDSTADKKKTVISELIAAGLVTADAAKAAGVYPIVKITELKAVSVAKAGTPELPKTVEATFKDGSKADVAVTWDAVDTTAVGEKTVNGTIANSKVKATIKVVVEEDVLKVVSVSAKNLKEVTVDFNKATDDTKSGLAANYTVKVDSTTYTVQKVTVSADKKSAVLTIGNDTTALPNQKDVAVTVKAAVGIAADDTKTITNLTDVTLPEVTAIKLTGPSTFELTLSEPIQANSATVTVNDGLYLVATKTLSEDYRTLTCNLGVTSLADGKYSIKISDAKDFAGMIMLKKAMELDYVKDTKAPVATIKSASQTEVVIAFDKPVKLKDGNNLNLNYFYHTYTAWKPLSMTVSADKKEYTLKFTDTNDTNIDPILPAGNVIVTVLKTVSDVPVVDLWGNQLESDAKLTATITVDVTAPTITKVEATAENKLEITFSEAVNEKAVKTITNYAIKDKDAKSITETITSISYADQKATLNLSGKLAGGKYSVEVKEITDTALAANKIVTVSKEFTVSDLTPPSLNTTDTVVTGVYTGASDVVNIYVQYNEKVKTSGTYADGCALDKNMYRIVKAGETTQSALPDGSAVTVFGSEDKVKITLPAGNVVPTSLIIGPVADVAGNKVLTFGTTFTVSAEPQPALFAAKTLSSNTIELDFVGKITGIDISSNGIQAVFSSVYNKAAATYSSVTYATNDTDKKTHTKVVVALTDTTMTSSQIPTSIVIGAEKITSDTGKKNAAQLTLTGTSITDGFAPAFKAPTTDAGKKITIGANPTVGLLFDEALSTDNVAFATTDLVISYDGSTLTPGTDYTIGIVNDTLTVTFKVVSIAGSSPTSYKFTANGKTLTAGKTVTVASKAAPVYLKDAAGNVLKTTFTQDYTLQ